MSEASSRLKAFSDLSAGLWLRVLILAIALIAEKSLLNHFVDFDQAQAAEGLGALVRETQHWVFRLIVALSAALALFAYVGGGAQLRSVDADMRAAPFRSSWLIVHLLLVMLLVPLSFWLYRIGNAPLEVAAIVIGWLLSGVGAASSLALALAPCASWRNAAKSFGILWIYALVAALFAVATMQLSQRLWSLTAFLTFDMVRHLLSPLLPALRTDPATLVLGTNRFAVEVSDVCSGLEGLGLMLGFIGAWLWYFRREYIFPRALLLIPVGLAAIFLLNTVRIAGLVLIGDAGFPDIAVYGFHSQAGWIAFNAVACALVFFSRRSTWLNRTAAIDAQATETHNPTAIYLLPLLALLAAAALSHAMSGRFETFYPLRLVAVAIVVLLIRRSLSAIDWRFTWRGPAVGTLVFIVWWLSARLLVHATGVPAGLAQAAPLLQMAWIGIRLVTTIIAVPFAEELAYRGYVMRRLTDQNFEFVAYRSVRWPAVCISSVAFGLAHGALWLPGIFAGVAYGLLAKKTDRLGESVAAHAASNALIAACVLGANQWELW